jgi:signal transduction histidine kinase
MLLAHWPAFLACVAQAMLALIALRARDPLGAPLALFGADVFVWSFADLAYHISGLPIWLVLDHAAAALIPALGLHVVLLFVGRRRELGRVLGALYGLFGALSVCATIALFTPRHAPLLSSTAWSSAFLLATLPGIAFGGWLLLSYRRCTTSADERARAGLLLLALPLAATFGATNAVNVLIPSVPRLGSVGAAGCAVLMMVVTLRGRLLGRELTSGITLTAGLLGAATVAAYLLVVRLFAANTAFLVVATATLSFAVIAATRALAAAAWARRARRSEMALMGRFSAQMAHDLKNPLAALKGAAQYLQEERRLGRSLADQGDFFEIIIDQADRLERLISTYQRLGRLEPVFAPIDVGALVRDVLTLQAFASSGTMVSVTLGDDLPTCVADRDLLARALENLVKNAFEAMPDGGALTVSVDGANEGLPGLIIRIADTGGGMDARTREHVFDEFYTTKATGSGLGLPFVRRVIEAHGGDVALRGEVGRGTVATLRLPACPPPEAESGTVQRSAHGVQHPVHTRAPRPSRQ